MTKRKIACYVLTISTKFPRGKARAGQSTNFESSIIDQSKGHTIRENYEYWKYRIDQINRGNAYLSVRKWTGKPYNSHQEEIATFGKGQVAIQKIKIGKMFCQVAPPSGIHQDKCTMEVPTAVISHNDGLSYGDFIDWFRNDMGKEFCIIHFSNKPYQYE